MHFTFPGGPGDANIHHHPYPHAHQTMAAFADVHETKGAFGSILQQYEQGVEYGFSKHRFELYDPLPLEVQLHTSVMVLAYTLDGHMDWEHPVIGTFALSKGQCRAYFLPAGPHRFLLQRGYCLSLKVHLSIKILFLLGKEPDAPWTLPSLQHSALTAHIIEMGFKKMAPVALRTVRVDQFALDLFLQYREEREKQASGKKHGFRITAEDVQVVKAAIKKLRQHTFGVLKVDAIARAVNMSVQKVRAVVKHSKGHGLRDDNTDYHLHRACELLLTTDKTVTEIANELELSNASALVRIFNRELQCTPGQYRRMNGNVHRLL